MCVYQRVCVCVCVFVCVVETLQRGVIFVVLMVNYVVVVIMVTINYEPFSHALYAVSM